MLGSYTCDMLYEHPEHFNIWHICHVGSSPAKPHSLFSHCYVTIFFINPDAFHFHPSEEFALTRQSPLCHSQRSKDNILTHLIRVQGRRVEMTSCLYFDRLSKELQIRNSHRVKSKLCTISAIHGIAV